MTLLNLLRNGVKFLDMDTRVTKWAMIENEIPKHRKKKQSSTSKSSTKSKHKHEYKEVLLIHNDRPHWATVCKICGKIGDLHFFETEPYRDGLWRYLDSNEVFEKY